MWTAARLLALAIASLEKFTANAEGDPYRRAAEQAIEKIRAYRKPADDYKNLRKEVADLKKSNSNLSRDLNDLKKRFDASIKTSQSTEKK